MALGPIISRAYGFNGYVNVFPQPIVATRAPVSGANGDQALNGQTWIDTANQDAYFMVDASSNTWINAGGGAGVFASLTVNPGPTALTGQLTVTSGTNAVSISDDAAANTVTIGTGAAAKTVTLGSANTTSTTTVQSGTGGASVTSTGLNTISSSRANNNAVNITASDAAGGVNISAANATILATYLAAGETHTLTNLPWTLATGTGTINVSNDAAATTANFGTGAGVKTVTVGSTNTTSVTTVRSGTGGVAVTTTATGTIAISADAAANTVNVGTGAAAKTVALGSSTAGSTTALNAPAAAGININNGTQTASIFVGSASPNGALTGTDGSIYLRTGTATASTVLYVCTGGTTWTAVTVP